MRTDVRTAAGRQRPPAAVGAGPLRQAGLDGELAGDGPLQVGGHPRPVDDAVARRGDAELVGRHALLVGVGLGAEHVEPVDRQHAGHAAEEAGPVGRHRGHAVAVGQHGGAALGHDQRHQLRGEQRPRGFARAPRRRARAPTRSTSSSTSSAFHEPHADGPVANESASVSAASSSSTQLAPDGLGDTGDGGVVAQVAPGGDVGQQEVAGARAHGGPRRPPATSPMRWPMRSTRSTPTTEWSPG